MNDNYNDSTVEFLSPQSRLRMLLIEYPPQREFPLISHKEIQKSFIDILTEMAGTPYTPIDDFYAMKLLIAEESAQTAAETSGFPSARCRC